eukprot:scaffold274038_cov33-Tisochrysis_lutea.AAC.2
MASDVAIAIFIVNHTRSRSLAYPSDSQCVLASVRWADSVVFVYPTWWFNVPGILKGWFDRTLCLGGAFDLPISKDDTVASNGAIPRDVLVLCRKFSLAHARALKMHATQAHSGWKRRH